jgi:hypothetical protein
LLDNGCYAHRARIAWGHANVIRSTKARSIEAALRASIRSARYIRFGTIGDPSAIDPNLYDEHMRLARSYGLGVLSYTHLWRTRGRWLRGKALASCDSMHDVYYAIKAGWRAAVHLPKSHPVIQARDGKTKYGATFKLCPAERERCKITCNDCGLCDPTRQAVDIIVFKNRRIREVTP